MAAKQKPAEWVTAEELAAELKLPLQTIYAFNKRGTGPPRLKLGRQIRYRRDDVDEWLAEKYAIALSAVIRQ